MKRALAVLTILVLVLGTVVPSDAWRGGSHHRGFHGGWWPGLLFGGLVGGLLIGSAVAASQPTVVYERSPVYVAPTPTYAQAPPAPAIQREVVYPHGRYVLYGDGLTQPYQWVWVPAVPPPPPPPAPLR